MSDNYGDLTAPTENNKLGPDLFGYYAQEAAQLLSHDDSSLPFPIRCPRVAESIHNVGIGKGKTKISSRAEENSGKIDSTSLFSDGLGAQLSEHKKERLRLLLRQSVFILTQEVDEMINPVLSVCRIHSCLRYKESNPSSNASVCKDDQSERPLKKPKVETKLSTDLKKCSPCLTTGTPPQNPASDGNKPPWNACGHGGTKDLNNGPSATSISKAGQENIVIDDDLRFILENDTTKVEELLRKHSGEISGTLHHMEQKLEELLNITMTTCRPMTVIEKHNLRKLIQSLPPTNLDHVVGIIAPNKPSDDRSCDELYVDLDAQDNVTLWRLYFYVKTYHASRKTENDDP